MSQNASIRNVYRELLRYTKTSNSREELRSAFRQASVKNESIEDRLKQAHSRLAVLKMSHPKRSFQNNTNSTDSTTTTTSTTSRWMYKNGQRIALQDRPGNGREDGQPTRRDTGQVVSNWDGKNLDPSSVKLHRQQLQRAGFVNNAHAKGFF